MWGHSGADLEGMSLDTGVALRRRDNSWCVSTRLGCTRRAIRCVLTTTTGRVNCAPPRPLAPPFQLFRGNQPGFCLVLPSWSLPLKISILRRKRVNVTLMCRRQIPELQKELRTVRAPLRAGSWPRVRLRTVSYEIP